MTWVGLQCVIVIFPDHTHLLFNKLTDCELRIVFESVSKTCCHGNCKLSAILLSSSSKHGIPEIEDLT